MSSSKRKQGEGGLQSQASPSQIDFLRQQLDHAEVRSRVHLNKSTLASCLCRLDRERRRSYCLREAIVTTKARGEGLRREAARLEEEIRRLTSASTRLTGRLNQTNTTILRKRAVLHSSRTLKVRILYYSYHHYD
ncbi:hypothetical protein Pmani_004512 [Petrolisthes manimaculis]|uniref:Uncharacterized protein n=1 Tax=Petrolisthes manimaculis TaxID=1843537 RepID=A0AAE1QGI8_9EUCA|nr:hypothetical protein Pmani_004512 [Petrolisthes manimaculis]